MTTYHVRARPLDDIVADTGVSRVDVVKIDVEGAEMLVLKGAAKTLARYHPVLIVELIDKQLRSMGTSEDRSPRVPADTRVRGPRDVSRQRGI